MTAPPVPPDAVPDDPPDAVPDDLADSGAPATSDVDLLSADAIRDPHSVFHELRSKGPIVWLERHRAWILTTHEAVRLAFHDRRLSSDRLTPMERRLDEAQRAAMGPTFELLRGWMVFHDPPDHARLREPLRRAFTPARIADLRPRIEEIVDGLLDDMLHDLEGGPNTGTGPGTGTDTGTGTGTDHRADREIDLVAEFAFPLPAIVIAELLGVPPEDRDDFKHWSDQLAAIVFGTADRSAGIERAVSGTDRFASYFAGLIQRSIDSPGDDLISALVAVTDDDPTVGLTPSELVGALTLILFGGHETTTNLIANSVNSLLDDRTALSWMAEHPDSLDGALEELHRFDGSTKVMVRVVAEHDRHGARLRPGDTVLLGVLGANRDPDVFDDPDSIDFGRTNSRAHLGYGSGSHFCLGAALARLETEIAIGKLVGRFASLGRGAAPVEWNQVLLGRGVRRLPVRLRSPG